MSLLLLCLRTILPFESIVARVRQYSSLRCLIGIWGNVVSRAFKQFVLCDRPAIRLNVTNALIIQHVISCRSCLLCVRHMTVVLPGFSNCNLTASPLIAIAIDLCIADAQQQSTARCMRSQGDFHQHDILTCYQHHNDMLKTNVCQNRQQKSFGHTHTSSVLSCITHPVSLHGQEYNI